GLARTISHDEAKGFGAASEFPTLKNLAKGEISGVPMPFIILLFIAVITWFLLHRSVYGRYLLAVGKNEEAARFSGINTRRVITSSYVLAGLLTGISAIMFALSTNQVTPSTHGMIYEVYGIAACVLGGCSLRGGEGSIIGIIVGITLLQVLENLVNLLGISSSSDWTVMGGVVLIGVIADQLLQRRAKKQLQQQPV
ncbi:MAG TPA: ABC transporter permease, partial [Pirellulales bacterium]